MPFDSLKVASMNVPLQIFLSLKIELDVHFVSYTQTIEQPECEMSSSITLHLVSAQIPRTFQDRIDKKDNINREEIIRTQNQANECTCKLYDLTATRANAHVKLTITVP
jgi:hypothetical protein